MHPLVSELAALKFENCFNPYADRCEVYDRPDAPNRRAKTLSSILERASASPIDAIWIGRDLGYRGGRRTGLALTDDVHVDRHAGRWGVAADCPTIGARVAERTAAVVWKVLDEIEERVFLWNVFPLHPHKKSNPFTNRQHNAKERSEGERILSLLIAMLRPKKLIAIGNDAFEAASGLSESVRLSRVRHPSYGGQAEFLQQMSHLCRSQGMGGQLF